MSWEPILSLDKKKAEWQPILSVDKPFSSMSSVSSPVSSITKTSTPMVSKEANPLLWIGDKIAKGFDYFSGMVAQTPAQTLRLLTGMKPDKPRTFSEQATSLAKAAYGEKAGPVVGVAIGTIGDPLNAVGGGAPKVVKIASETDNYVTAMVKAREAARIAGSPGFIAKSKSVLSSIKTKLVDFAAPIEDILRNTLKKNKMSLLPEDNVRNAIDRTLRAPTIAGNFAEKNGLIDVIRKAPNIDYLDQYLIAKHAMELEARGITTGRDLVKDKKLITDIGAEYEPFAKKVSDYSRAILDYATDSGLVSKETNTLLKERYPDYVPFSRVISDVEKEEGITKGSKGVASLSKQTVVQRIEGSERQVESPIESLLAKTTDAFLQGEKNKAARTLASYEKLPGNPFELTEVTDKTPAGPHTISFFDDGVKRTFNTTKEIAEAAKSLNVQQLNILGQVLAFPVRIAKAGITGINPSFALSNLARDQVGAAINTDKALQTSIANPKNFVQALFSAVKHDGLYKEMVEAGGGGTSFDMWRNQVTKTADQIRGRVTLPGGKKVESKVLYTVLHPGSVLRSIENVIGRTEELTRIQQYNGMKKALMKDGLSEASAKIEAARVAREASINFSRRGDFGIVMNNALLYMNPSIQGSRTLVRNLRDKPVATAAKIATLGLFPVAVVTAWNLSDPERKKAYEDIPEYEKANNLIVIPPNPKKDDKGKWNVYKIPVSQNINDMMNMVRRPMEAAHGLDPVGFGEMAQSLISTVSPVEPTKGSMASSLTPQAIKPTLESYANKNFFTGNPIVSQGKENLPNAQQVNPDTSATAKQIAARLDLSPIKVQAWIKGTFGGSGLQALNIIDQVQAKMGRITPDQIGGQSVLDAITARFNKAQGGAVLDKVYEAEKIADTIKAGIRNTFKEGTYKQIQDLAASGDKAGALKLLNELPDDQYEMYKNIRTAERAKRTDMVRMLLRNDPKKAVDYIKQQSKEEQDRILKLLTDEEYKRLKQGI